MMLSSWQSHYENSTSSSDECSSRHHVAAIPQTKSADLSPPVAASIHIHHRCLLFIYYLLIYYWPAYT